MLLRCLACQFFKNPNEVSGILVSHGLSHFGNIQSRGSQQVSSLKDPLLLNEGDQRHSHFPPEQMGEVIARAVKPFRQKLHIDPGVRQIPLYIMAALQDLVFHA